MNDLELTQPPLHELREISTVRLSSSAIASNRGLLNVSIKMLIIVGQLIRRKISRTL
jgi:hypothetical protein